ncbi:hypothetical protein D1872_300780 [compost metagenome]
MVEIFLPIVVSDTVEELQKSLCTALRGSIEISGGDETVECGIFRVLPSDLLGDPFEFFGWEFGRFVGGESDFDAVVLFADKLQR